MELIKGLPRTSRQHDYIMVVNDKLTEVAYLILVMSMNSISEVSQIFIREIVRLHGIPRTIVSRKDSKFTSRFWKELFVGLVIELASNTTYHLQTYGQIERVNKIWRTY